MSSILIVGSYGIFTNDIINKFYKENWRIYTLISSKFSKPDHVFEQYIFPYDSDSIRDVIISCRPDVILFTGAYDPLFVWGYDNPKEESLNYIAGLSNLLMSATMNDVRNFIYVSSDKVYEEEYIVDINDDMPSTPKSYQGMLISQGENLALHFGQKTQMEVTIARISHMYGIPTNRTGCIDFISKMCMKAMISGRIKVNGKKILSAIFIKDAIEALYQIIKAPERKYAIYNISSMEEINEDEVAQLIKENYSHPIDIIDQTIGLRSRVVLSNVRLQEEFAFQVKYSYKQVIPLIVTYMKNHKHHFQHEEEKYSGDSLLHRFIRLFRKAIPFLESIVFFIPFFMLNNRSVGSNYFNEINFYLLYVLLFAVVHGRQQAIFASMLSVIGYSFRQLYTSTGFSLLTNLNTYIWVAQIFIVGLTVGHLKDRSRETELDKNEKIDFLTERLNDITLINSSNTKIKNYFADKLISSTESIGRIYEITSKLESAEKGEVMFAALDTLSEVMHTEDVSIYLVSNSKYCRLSVATSTKARSLGKSILMTNYEEIFNALEHKQVFINRSLESDLPMMGSALFDDKDDIRIIIFIWSIPYEKMTLYQANLLNVVGALIYSAMVRDADYLEALSYRRYIPGTKILQEEAFQELQEIYQKAKEKDYAESCVFYVQREDRSLQEMNEMIHPLLRDTDYVGVMPDGDLVILLSNANMNEYNFVKKRMEENNLKAYLGD